VLVYNILSHFYLVQYTYIGRSTMEENLIYRTDMQVVVNVLENAQMIQYWFEWIINDDFETT